MKCESKFCVFTQTDNTNMKWLHTTRRRNKNVSILHTQSVTRNWYQKKTFSQHNSYIEVYNARDIAEASVSKQARCVKTIVLSCMC